MIRSMFMRVNVTCAHCAELPLQHVTKLVQQGLRRNDDVLADAVFEEIAAGTARDEGGNQHVRIQEEFHEMRVNTSASV